MIAAMKEKELSLPPGLFRGVKSFMRNDRYVVYRMLNRLVSFVFAHEKVEGYVEEVYRDIFGGEVRLKIRGRTFAFKEPVLIKCNTKEMVFLYGDIGRKELTDEQVFDEMRKEQFRETVSDTMHRLDPKKVYSIRFVLGEKKTLRRKPSVMRGIPSNILVPA